MRNTYTGNTAPLARSQLWRALENKIHGPSTLGYVFQDQCTIFGRTYRELYLSRLTLDALALGALATGATFCLLSFAVGQRGTTYPSMFNPLSLILVAITEALFLGEDIRVDWKLAGHAFDHSWILLLVGKEQGVKECDCEQGKTVPESEAGMQLTAVVVPTASTVYMDDVEGLPNRNQPEPLNV